MAAEAAADKRCHPCLEEFALPACLAAVVAGQMDMRVSQELQASSTHCLSPASIRGIAGRLPMPPMGPKGIHPFYFSELVPNSASHSSIAMHMTYWRDILGDCTCS